MDMQNSNSGNRYNDNSYLYHQLPQYVANETPSTALSETLTKGGDVDGLMTLFMNNTSTRRLAKKVVQFNGAAVLGALAYKAHTYWQGNHALNEMTPITGYDVTQASPLPCFPRKQAAADKTLLITVLMKTMIAASKVHEVAGQDEQRQLLKAAKQLGFTTTERNFIEDLMNRDITVQDITRDVSLGKHKCEVYLAAYLATNDSNPIEDEFLAGLASAMNLPEGLTHYLELQAKLGIAD